MSANTCHALSPNSSVWASCTFTGNRLMIVAKIRKRPIHTAASTFKPTAQAKNVLPSLYSNFTEFATAVSSSAARTAYPNLVQVRKSYDSAREVAHQYIQPTAKPTPRSKNRLGNSITGAFTGMRAVISPKQEITDEITVPIRT